MLVKDIPRLSAFVPITNCLVYHAQRLGSEHSLLLQVFQLKDQISGKNELDAVTPLRIMLPAALNFRTPNDNETQGFICGRTPCCMYHGVTLRIVPGQSTDAWA